MGNNKNWLDVFSTYMDQNIRGVQYGIYTVAGLGLFIALKSVRPFAKFCLPSDIPKHFIEKKMGFHGRVNFIEPGSSAEVNPVLLVDHKPLISLSKKNNNQGLPVEISSVNISNNGFIWLQSTLTSQEIKFVPVRTSKDRVYSIVFKENQNIGHHLIKIGFATVAPIDFSLHEDPYYLKYYKSLLSAEKKAERKGAGLWAFGKMSYVKYLISKVKNALPFSI